MEQMLEIGKQSLTNLAKHEMENTASVMFFRYGAWHVKQSIIDAIEGLKQNIGKDAKAIIK